MGPEEGWAQDGEAFISQVPPETKKPRPKSGLLKLFRLPYAERPLRCLGHTPRRVSTRRPLHGAVTRRRPRRRDPLASPWREDPGLSA